MEKKRIFKIIAIVGLIASLLTIFGFLTDTFSVKGIIQKFNNSDTDNITRKEPIPEPKNTQESKPAETQAGTPVFKKEFWNFDDGDLRGLTEKNVVLTKEDKTNGLYLDFWDYSDDSILRPERKLSPPWELGFSAILNRHRSFIIFICFSAGTSTFTINVEGGRFSFRENGKELFYSFWKYGGEWIGWVIQCSVDGKLSIVINEKPFFNYVFRTFKYSEPTKIEFKSPAGYSFRLDNLSID
ncbi:MAG: hypothetical protein GY765_00215 [bacterium]|nr:hypothetical protein [bacterium]